MKSIRPLFAFCALAALPLQVHAQPAPPLPPVRPAPPMLPTQPQAVSPSTNDALGRQLEDRLWTDFEKANIADLQKFISPSFQSLHEDGARTGPEELKLIAGLNMSAYSLSKIQATRSGDTMIVTYIVTVGETINGQRLPDKTTPRMDVFQLQNGARTWLAHVNVRPLLTSSETLATSAPTPPAPPAAPPSPLPPRP